MAKPYGKTITYQISHSAIEMLLQQRADAKQTASESKRTEPVNYQRVIQSWKSAMQKGGMTGKPFSPLTIDYYTKNIEGFLKKHSVFNAQTVQIEFSRTGRNEFAKRFKLYKAVVSFGKSLIRHGMLDENFLREIKPLQPKRHAPPKRLTVNESELQTILDACETLQERVIVLLLASTGIRAAECCAIQLQHIDFEEGRLDIPIGKGGKTRKLGLTTSLSALLQEYISVRENTHPAMALLLDADRKLVDRYDLYRILKRIGKRAGVPVHPHALRRAFVTINAGKGRPLVYLQKACGHSDIKTTMSYCRTTEQEVIEAMKGWD